MLIQHEVVAMYDVRAQSMQYCFIAHRRTIYWHRDANERRTALSFRIINKARKWRSVRGAAARARATETASTQQQQK